MAYNMKGSPAKLGTIQGTTGHSSALKKLAEDKVAKGGTKKTVEIKGEKPERRADKWKRVKAMEGDPTKNMESEYGGKWSRESITNPDGTTRSRLVNEKGQTAKEAVLQEGRDAAAKKAEYIKKNKTSPVPKASPAKGILGDKWKDLKGKAKKAYDKASQVGMGLKQMGAELSGDRSDFPSAGYGTKQPIRAFKEGYKKEKNVDEGRAGLDYSQQKRDQKADPKAMKKAMVTRYNKKKADERDKAAKIAKKKRDDKIEANWNKRMKGGR